MKYNWNIIHDWNIIPKRSTRNISIFAQNTPMKTEETKITKNVKIPKTPVMKESGEDTKLDEIYDMIKTMMMKLEALDKIEERMKAVEKNVMEVKKSMEFAHEEIIDLKDETRKNKKWLTYMK
jgi:DNA-binding transcriptional regulator GbsR (MarR family)